MTDEQVKCNICDVTVASSQAQQHSSTEAHIGQRANMEKELEKVRKTSYENDTSVVNHWRRSLAT